MEICELHLFEKKHEIFPINRKSYEYKQINTIRTKLLKINAKEAKNYLNQKIRINSQTTKDYLKKSFESITINLKTKQIQNAKKTRVSFINNIHDLDIEPFFIKCNRHFHKFQNRKKIVLAKHGLHFEKESSDSDKSERNNEYDIDNNDNGKNNNHYHCHDDKKEEMFNLLIGKINQKTYFNYLPTADS